MARHCGELAIGKVSVQTMPAPFTQKDAVVFCQEFYQYLPFHRTATRRRKIFLPR